MRICAVAVGQRVPGWVREGFAEYARRLPPHCRLDLIEVPAARRTRRVDLVRLTREEGERLISAAPSRSRLIALSRSGRPRSTEELAGAFGQWLAGGQDVAILIGGPEGLDDACLARCEEVWSLSPLTMGYPVVRIVLAEQLYRAWSITAGLPYHRQSRRR